MHVHPRVLLSLSLKYFNRASMILSDVEIPDNPQEPIILTVFNSSAVYAQQVVAFFNRTEVGAQAEPTDFVQLDPTNPGKVLVNPTNRNGFIRFMDFFSETRKPWLLLEELVEKTGESESSITLNNINGSLNSPWGLTECDALRRLFQNDQNIEVVLEQDQSGPSTFIWGDQSYILTVRQRQNPTAYPGNLKALLQTAKEENTPVFRSMDTLIQMLLGNGYNLDAGEPFLRPTREAGSYPYFTDDEQNLLQTFFIKHPALDLLCYKKNYGTDNQTALYQIAFLKTGEELRNKLTEALEIIEHEKSEKLFGGIKNAAS